MFSTHLDFDIYYKSNNRLSCSHFIVLDEILIANKGEYRFVDCGDIKFMVDLQDNNLCNLYVTGPDHAPFAEYVARNKVGTIEYVEEHQLPILRDLFPAAVFEEIFEDSDAVYPVERFSEFAGSSKRKWEYKKFVEQYPFKFFEFTQEHIGEVSRLFDIWRAQSKHPLDNDDITFLNYCYGNALPLTGYCLKVGGRMAGYGFGVLGNGGAYIIVLLKCDISFKGIYPAMRKFMTDDLIQKHGITHINYMNFSMNKGLQQSKLLLRPEILRCYDAKIL